MGEDYRYQEDKAVAAHTAFAGMGEAMNPDSVAMKAPKASPIDQIFSDQDELLERLGNAVVRLEDKISPVLSREDYPSMDGESDGGDPPTTSRSTVYNQVDHANDTIRSILHRVQRMNDQIEL